MLEFQKKMLIKSFIFSIQFLTIFPVKLKQINKKMVKSSTIFFPITGLLIGSLNYAFFFLLCKIMPLGLSLFFTVAFLYIITGALHVDGFSDTVDALMSCKKGKEFIKIMRDTKIGAGGTLAIVFNFLARFLILANMPSHNIAEALIFAPLLSRWHLSLLSNTFNYASVNGKGKDFINKNTINFVISTASFVLLYIIFYKKLIYAVMICTLLILLSAYYFNKKLKGITGDILGFNCEISEILMYLFFLKENFIGGILYAIIYQPPT